MLYTFGPSLSLIDTWSLVVSSESSSEYLLYGNLLWKTVLLTLFLVSYLGLDREPSFTNGLRMLKLLNNSLLNGEGFDSSQNISGLFSVLTGVSGSSSLFSLIPWVFATFLKSVSTSLFCSTSALGNFSSNPSMCISFFTCILILS